MPKRRPGQPKPPRAHRLLETPRAAKRAKTYRSRRGPGGAKWRLRGATDGQIKPGAGGSSRATQEALRTAQEPPKTTQEGLRSAKTAPGAAKRAQGRSPEASPAWKKPWKTTSWTPPKKPKTQTPLRTQKFTMFFNNLFLIFWTKFDNFYR